MPGLGWGYSTSHSGDCEKSFQPIGGDSSLASPGWKALFAHESSKVFVWASGVRNVSTAKSSKDWLAG